MNFASIGNQVDPVRRTWSRWLPWMVIGFGWLLLFADTLRIREANLDDVDYHRAAIAGRRWEKVKSFSQSQARYFGPIAFLPYWTQDSIANPWLYQVVRLGLVAASLFAIGTLATRITGSPEVLPLWGLIWIAVLQIPPTFYGLLSYPAFHCGLILVFAALNRFWTRLQHPAESSAAWEAGLVYFVALHFSEVFLVFAVAFAALWGWQTPAADRARRFRLLYPIVAACALYLSLYFGYRALNPSTYEGTVVGHDIRKVFVYLFRYSAASLPGFEIVIDRDIQHGAIHSWPEIAQRLGTLNGWRVPWAIVAAGTSGWLLYSSSWRPSLRFACRLSGAALAMGLLYLAVPALAEKYQDFAYRRFYPYVYNFGFVHLAWLAVVITALGIAGQFPRDSHQRWLAATGFSSLIFAACLAAQISNPLALEEIHRIVSDARVMFPF